jgi:hypothetical protein
MNIFFLKSSHKPRRMFTPLEIMPHCSAAGLHFNTIPAGSNPLRLRYSAASAPLEFLTRFTIQRGKRRDFLTGEMVKFVQECEKVCIKTAHPQFSGHVGPF